jgi:DNA-directed RNA polymerase specialized sigma24 family protein
MEAKTYGLRNRHSAVRFVGPHRRDVAEDIAQEALLRMVRNEEPIQTTWQALLRTIVTRLVWNHRRDEETQRGHVRFDSEAALLAQDGWPGPPDLLIERETEAELWILLGQLDERFGAGTRAIFELRSQGVPWKEIVAIVELSVRTCSNRETAAIEWLYQRLSLQETRGRHHE